MFLSAKPMFLGFTGTKVRPHLHRTSLLPDAVQLCKNCTRSTWRSSAHVDRAILVKARRVLLDLSKS